MIITFNCLNHIACCYHENDVSNNQAPTPCSPDIIRSTIYKLRGRVIRGKFPLKLRHFLADTSGLRMTGTEAVMLVFTMSEGLCSSGQSSRALPGI